MQNHPPQIPKAGPARQSHTSLNQLLRILHKNVRETFEKGIMKGVLRSGKSSSRFFFAKNTTLRKFQHKNYYPHIVRTNPTPGNLQAIPPSKTLAVLVR